METLDCFFINIGVLELSSFHPLNQDVFVRFAVKESDGGPANDVGRKSSEIAYATHSRGNTTQADRVRHLCRRHNLQNFQIIHKV